MTKSTNAKTSKIMESIEPPEEKGSTNYSAAMLVFYLGTQCPECGTSFCTRVEITFQLESNPVKCPQCRKAIIWLRDFEITPLAQPTAPEVSATALREKKGL